MKVIGICGSSRKDGNTYLIMKEVMKQINKQGIKTEIIQLCDYEIKPCLGCYHCEGIRRCLVQEDCFNSIFDKMISADGVIFGSPVYCADLTAKMKAYMERASLVISVNRGLLKHKVCASVVAVRRGGGSTTVDSLNRFFLNKEVVMVGSTYWNMVYGDEVGEVLEDQEGIENMRNLGDNMAEILKKLNR